MTPQQTSALMHWLGEKVTAILDWERTHDVSPLDLGLTEEYWDKLIDFRWNDGVREGIMLAMRAMTEVERIERGDAPAYLEELGAKLR